MASLEQFTYNDLPKENEPDSVQINETQSHLKLTGRNIESQDGRTYKFYTYAGEGFQFEVFYKDPEQLFDPELTHGKTVIDIGNRPYVRDDKAIGENVSMMDRQADHHYRVNEHGVDGQKYHIPLSVFFIDPWIQEEFRHIDKMTERHAKADINFVSLETAQNAAKDGELLFVVNKQPEAILFSAKMINKCFPEIGQDPAIAQLSLPQIEDLLAAAAIGPDGKIVEDSSDSRNLLLSAALGNKEDHDQLLLRYKQWGDRFPAFELYQMQQEKLAAEIKLTSDLFREEQKIYLRQHINKINQLIERYQERGKVEISDEVIAELDKHVTIHMTNFKPFFDQKSERWFIQSHSGATGAQVGRLTVHFAIDGIATAAAITTGDWDKKKYAIVAPLGQMIKANGMMGDFLPADTWWLVDPDEPGVELPAGTTIVCQTELNPLSNGVEQFKISSEEDPSTKLKHLLRDKYGVWIRAICKESWSDSNSDSDKKKIEDLIETDYPVLKHSLHSHSKPSNFEDHIFHYMRKVMEADHQNELKEILERVKKEETDGNGRRHSSSQDEIFNSLKLLPEQVVLEAKKDLIRRLNSALTPVGYDTEDVEERRKKTPVRIPREFSRLLVKLGII